MDNEKNFGTKIFGGYKKQHVDEFIASQNSLIESLKEDFEKLHQELEAVKAESETQKGELKACLAEIIKDEEEIKTLTASNNAYIAEHDHVMQIEVVAREKAETLMANAKKTAEVTVYSAEIMAEHTTDCANITASDIIAEAQKKTEEINAECHATINACTSEILNYQVRLNRFATVLQNEHSKLNVSIGEMNEKIDTALHNICYDEPDVTADDTSEAITE